MAFPLLRVAAICAGAGYTYWRLRFEERETQRVAARDALQD